MLCNYFFIVCDCMVFVVEKNWNCCVRCSEVYVNLKNRLLLIKKNISECYCLIELNLCLLVRL